MIMPSRKISHQIWDKRKFPPKKIDEYLDRGSTPPPGLSKMDPEERTAVILRKADDFPLTALLDSLTSLDKECDSHIMENLSGHTDFFVFIKLNYYDLFAVANLAEVDRIFLDEQVTAHLDQSVETTKARASWNTFQHYGDKITWAVVDSGINDRHPLFYDSDPSSSSQAPTRSQKPKWSEGLREKDWFKQIGGPGKPAGLRAVQIEPGYTGSAVVMRFLLNDDEEYAPHGTHIAGIIAGRESRQQARLEGSTEPVEKGVCGLAPKAQLVDFRVLDKDSNGDASITIAALFIIRKINEEAGRPEIAGVNLSLGHPYNPWDFGCGGSLICEEVDRLVHSGVIVVVSAGNSGYAEFSTTQFSDSGQESPSPQRLFNFQSITDPGNAREAITVGSTHKLSPHRWGPSYFSSRGPTGDGRFKPDLLAPGEKIVSCHANFDDQDNVPLLFLSMSGTSQAAAMVSGGLALFLSIHPEFVGRPLEVKEKLLACCTDLKRGPHHQGFGLLDIFRLCQSV
jgi:serine protease AprX